MEYDKKIAVVGIGNCGSQIAALAEKKHPTIFESIYINTSESDLSMVQSESLKIKIGLKDHIEGSGANRSKMKEYLEKEIMELIQNEGFVAKLKTKKYVVVASSTAGGTGSGSAPVLLDILRNAFPITHFILVSVLPSFQASSMLGLMNTIEFLDELYNGLGPGTTYMLYDNETRADMSPTEALVSINDNIVEDLRILSGIDNYPTAFDSIDDADMESILTTPGRLVVARVTKGITEKTMEDTCIDDLIIKAIKSSGHTETERNKRIVRCGIITHFTEGVNKLYTAKFEKLNDFIGVPVERFNHHSVHDKNESMNFLYFIAAGLSPINDKTEKINNRIQYLKDAAKDDTDKFIGGDESMGGIDQFRVDNSVSRQEGFKASAIFAKFKKK